MALQNMGATAMLRDGLFGETRYLALFVGDTEVNGNNYSRKEVAAVNFAFLDNTATVRSDIAFATPSGSWGDVTKIGIYDADTGGNLLWDFNLTNDPDAITQSGTTVVIRGGAGTLTIPLS